MKLEIAASVRDSPLFRNGGFRVYPGLFARCDLDRLLDEALRHLPNAIESSAVSSDAEELRGGNPARRFLTVPGGHLQSGWYQSPRTIEFVGEATGVQVMPTGNGGTFSYYARPGDFLGIHRDIVTCDLAVISCLYDDSPPASSGGMLCLFCTRWSEPLSTIRADPARGGRKLRLGVGETIVLLGGIVPHAVLPIAAGQTRIVSVLCYRVTGR